MVVGFMMMAVVMNLVMVRWDGQCLAAVTVICGGNFSGGIVAEMEVMMIMVWGPLVGVAMRDDHNTGG